MTSRRSSTRPIACYETTCSATSTSRTFATSEKQPRDEALRAQHPRRAGARAAMRCVFMGSPEFAASALEALIPRHEVVLVVTQPDKPAGRGGKLSAPPVKVVAERAGIPVFQPRSARPPEVAEQLRAAGADIGVVVAYGKILPRGVLEAFPRGCINIHGSLLPAYRGAAPIQWAVIDGHTVTGVTIMQLDEGMDTGPMLLTRELTIGPEETAGELFARMAPVGAEAMLDALDGLAAGTLLPRAQPVDGASHARMLTKADGAIDFARPATAVSAHIRGVDPWPGAVAQCRGETLKLFRARVIVDEAPSAGQAAPGTVLAIDERGAIVACASGAVALRELQLPARRRMAAREVAAGRAITVGDVLAPPPRETP
ncbi:MAG TPA: methionyl-tRNA formyltransferase [Kofleriaceae bacterium]|nr:methionyl-tRNA formyltransferase [Kofleriaceae bacterium]